MVLRIEVIIGKLLMETDEKKVSSRS